MNYWTQSNQNIYVAAHRGWSEHYPENTMEAFLAAAKLGVDQIETDVRLTKDGQLVLFHDETLERVTDGSGKVIDHTLAELKKLRVKGRGKIPTLEEFLEIFEEYPTLTLDMELKEYPTEGREELAYHTCDRVLTGSAFGENMFRTAFTQTHNLSISGADDKFDYYVSARLYDNNGLFDSQVNPDSYKLYNGRVKVGYQVTPWLKITSNTDIAYSKYVMPETQSEAGGNIWRNIADEGHPCSPIINPDGTLSYSGVYSVGDILYGGSNRTYTNRQAQNTVAAKATFFDKRLRLNADFTYRARSYDTHVHRLQQHIAQGERRTHPA